MTSRVAFRLRCPECRSVRLTRDGTQVSRRRKVQRWLCHNCLRRTIYPYKDGRRPS